MRDKRKKNAILIQFNDECKSAIQAQPKPNRSHRRRLEAYRPKIHAMLADSDFKGIAENRLKILNVVLHFAKSGDEVQLERSMESLAAESELLYEQLNKKYQ